MAVSVPDLAKRVLDTLCLEGSVAEFQKLQDDLTAKAKGDDYTKELQAKFAPPVSKKEEPKEEPKKEEPKKEEPKVENKSKSLFELIWGISEEEYDECVGNFARLHGTTKEEWGL